MGILKREFFHLGQILEHPVEEVALSPGPRYGGTEAPAALLRLPGESWWGATSEQGGVP